MGARFVQDGMGAEARYGNSMQASIPPAVILSEAKDACNRLRPHRSVILSEAKDPCNRLHPQRPVILSEAKDLCNRLHAHLLSS
jgi:hypothetical protein